MSDTTPVTGQHVSRAATSGLPPGGPRWARRRLAFAAVLTAVLGTVLLLRAVAAPESTVAATVAAVVAVVLASAALSTFVPTAGPLHRLDLGCGPCAAAGGLLAGGATWLAVSDPTDIGTATMALGLGGIALVQRLSQPPSCPTAPRPPESDDLR